jgi:hypothetical protein
LFSRSFGSVDSKRDWRSVLAKKRRIWNGSAEKGSSQLTVDSGQFTVHSQRERERDGNTEMGTQRAQRKRRNRKEGGAAENVGGPTILFDGAVKMHGDNSEMERLVMLEEAPRGSGQGGTPPVFAYVRE